MADVHARGEEAKFYALEQKSLLRDKDTPFSTKAFSWLYWLASDYGQSVMRPLLGLLVTFLMFSAIYVAYLMNLMDLMPPGFVFLQAHGEDVLRFALRQVFKPFEVFSARGGSSVPTEATLETLTQVPLLLAFLAAVHSVLTLSFLALFLLALRRRFKLD